LILAPVSRVVRGLPPIFLPDRHAVALTAAALFLMPPDRLGLVALIFHARPPTPPGALPLVCPQRILLRPARYAILRDAPMRPAHGVQPLIAVPSPRLALRLAPLTAG